MRAWEDAHVDERRERGRQDRERNRDHRAELQRIYRQAPEIKAGLLEANRDRRRLARRLEKAGLPPKSVHPATAAERRRNEEEAERFFTNRRTAEERRRIQKEYVPTPPELIEKWERSSRRARERRQELAAVKRYVAKCGDRLREEAALDSRARMARGASPLDVDVEVFQRALEAVRPVRAAVAGEQRQASTGPHLPNTATRTRTLAR
jgi:hypothetical protein